MLAPSLLDVVQRMLLIIKFVGGKFRDLEVNHENNERYTVATHAQRTAYEHSSPSLNGYRVSNTVRPYLFDLTLLGPDRPHFGRLQIKMIVTSYFNAPHARA